MRSDTGIVWECSKSAKCEFHIAGGASALPCSGSYAGASFTPDPKTAQTFTEAVRQYERYLIASALKRSKGAANHSAAAAKLLGMTRQGLEYRLNGTQKSIKHLWQREQPTISRHRIANRKSTHIG